MAHLWIRDTTGGYAVAPLEGDLFSLENNRTPPLARCNGRPDAAPRRSSVALLLRTDTERGGKWALVAGLGGDIRLNGRRLPAGLAVLSDRDEIRLDGLPRFYFSTEELARVEPYPPDWTPTPCPRCREEIGPGCSAVRCPVCGVFYHQDEAQERPCWTYGENCVTCGQSSELSSRYRWSPEYL